MTPPIPPRELIANGKMTGTVKQDAEGMAAAIAQIAKAVGEGTALKDAVAATAESNTEMYSVAEGVATKLYVAYAPLHRVSIGHKNSD